MVRKLIPLLFLVALLVGIPQSNAQAASAGGPMILTINGDLWSWKGPGTKLERRTEWGYNYAPILSPDGKTVAYKSTARVAVDAIRAGKGPDGAGDLPASIWLLDVASNEAKRIADQPKDASIFNSAVPDNFIIRSDPTWSPDGTAVAWTEVPIQGVNGPFNYRLLVYYVATGTTATLVPTLPAQKNYEGITPMAINWGNQGLGVFKMDAVVDDSGLHTEGSILLYSPAGALLMQSRTVRNPVSFFWLETISDGYVPILTSTVDDSPQQVKWNQIKLMTGDVVEMKGIPEFYYEPDRKGGLAIHPAGKDLVGEWQLTAPGLPPRNIPAMGGLIIYDGRVTFSPDGSQFAYISQDGVMIAAGGNLVFTSLGTTPLAIAWGPGNWHIRLPASG